MSSSDSGCGPAPVRVHCWTAYRGFSQKAPRRSGRRVRVSTPPNARTSRKPTARWLLSTRPARPLSSTARIQRADHAGPEQGRGVRHGVDHALTDAESAVVVQSHELPARVLIAGAAEQPSTERWHAWGTGRRRSAHGGRGPPCCRSDWREGPWVQPAGECAAQSSSQPRACPKATAADMRQGRWAARAAAYGVRPVLDSRPRLLPRAP